MIKTCNGCKKAFDTSQISRLYCNENCRMNFHVKKYARIRRTKKVFSINVEIENLPNESWKPVLGYEGLYEVSSYGRVKSISRTVKYPNGKVSTYLGILIKLITDCKGYYRANLCNNTSRHSRQVHRLVALSFIKNPENKPQVNHKDGNPKNNNVSNLEWNTPSENNQHAYDTGLKSLPLGSLNSMAKLNEEKVKEIKIMIRDSGLYLKDIAKIYEVSESCIKGISRNGIWKHVIV